MHQLTRANQNKLTIWIHLVWYTLLLSIIVVDVTHYPRGKQNKRNQPIAPQDQAPELNSDLDRRCASSLNTGRWRFIIQCSDWKHSAPRMRSFRRIARRQREESKRTPRQMDGEICGKPAPADSDGGHHVMAVMGPVIFPLSGYRNENFRRSQKCFKLRFGCQMEWPQQALKWDVPSCKSCRHTHV